MVTRLHVVVALVTIVTMLMCLEAKPTGELSSGSGSDDDKHLLTLNFMGDGSYMKKPRDHKSHDEKPIDSKPHKEKQSGVESRDSELANSKLDDKSSEKEKMQESSSEQTTTKPSKDDRRDNLHVSKPKQVNAAARANIADDINRIDDISSLYHQGIKNEDEMDRVKQIDAGELNDYFHALNGGGENDKTSADNPDILRQRNHDDDVSQPIKSHKNDEEVSNFKGKENSPGYEVFSDNPDESDTDDFYDDISEGKKPEMKQMRPTKSHFGERENHREINQATNSASISKDLRNTEDQVHQREPMSTDHERNNERQMVDTKKVSNEPDPDTLGYPYSVDKEPTETTAENLDKERQRPHTLPEPKTNDEVNDNGHKEYADTKEGVAETNDKESHGTGNVYNNPFLNPLFNPFNLFGGLQRKQHEKQQDSTQKETDNIQETTHEEEDRQNQQNNEREPSQKLDENKHEGNHSEDHKEENRHESSSSGETQKTHEPHEPEDHKPFNIKGTRIQGGRITGGTITGGVIEGGEITAGHIEGGTIKGGHVDGGKFKNGIMEGGILHDGLIEGGHLMNGSFEGGRMKGGNIYGGRIQGGSIFGGDIKGGVLLGGLFHGGTLEGGVMKGGVVHGGKIKGGNVEGGVMTGGSVEGGTMKFGKLSGGTIKAGSMIGGEMTNGSIEGGVLKGGSISGGILRGGVMEGGQLKGGIVLDGRIKGGIIEGGVILGGEINDGVIIKSGRINGTILAMKASDYQKEKEEKEAKEDKEADKAKPGETQGEVGALPQVIYKEPKHVSHASNPSHGNKLVIIDDINNMKTTVGSEDINSPSFAGPDGASQNGTVTTSINLNPSSGTHPTALQDASQHSTEDPSIPSAVETQPSTFSQPNEYSYSQPSAQYRDLTPTNKTGKHHIVVDGVGFDVSDDKLESLIADMSLSKLKELETQASQQLHEVMHAEDEKQADKELHDILQIDAKKVNLQLNKEMHRENQKQTQHLHEKMHNDAHQINHLQNIISRNLTAFKNINGQAGLIDENSESKLNASQTNEDVDEYAILSLATGSPSFRPSYHWSLSNIMGDRIPGSPGAAMISHGHIRRTRGGLAFNGEDAWLGGGDFAGGCISAPDKCDDGFAFEMTLKIDKDSLFKSDDMRYIVDSGASTFNSKGFSLYTLHGKLRADIAIPNDSVCVESPLEADKWHDVLVTWRKDKGLKMYLNCDLKGQAKSSEQCLGCRSRGCHVTDVNTQLMVGRPNYSPHFHCTKFESGDISFWEKYLDDEDVNRLCGRDLVSKDSSRPTAAPQTAATQQLATSSSPTAASQQQRYADYQANTGQQQQVYTNPMTSFRFRYQSPFQSSSSPQDMYLKPGQTYHFTEYLPGTGNENRASELYSTYYAGQTRSNTNGLRKPSRPSYVRAGKRDKTNESENVKFSEILENALDKADGNLIVARQMIARNHDENSKKRSKIWKKLRKSHRHGKKSKLSKKRHAHKKKYSKKSL